MQKCCFSQAGHFGEGGDHVSQCNAVSLSSFLITLATSIVKEGRETPLGSIFGGNTDALNALQIGLSFLLKPMGSSCQAMLSTSSCDHLFQSTSHQPDLQELGQASVICVSGQMALSSFCANWNNFKRSCS